MRAPFRMLFYFCKYTFFFAKIVRFSRRKHRIYGERSAFLAKVSLLRRKCRVFGKCFALLADVSHL